FFSSRRRHTRWPRDWSSDVCSSDLQFAVLFGKPIIFVTTDELIPCYEGRSIAKVAAELGKSAINLDGDLRAVDWREQLHVDSCKIGRASCRERVNVAETAGCGEDQT